MAKENRIVAYPKPYITNQIKVQAEKQGTTISKIVQTALTDYFKKSYK